MGLFDSSEERDREAGEKLGREEREYREKHNFSFPINELAGDFDAIDRGPEFQVARFAAREGRGYEPPERSSNSSSKSSGGSSWSGGGGGGSGGYSGGGGSNEGKGCLGCLGIILLGSIALLSALGIKPPKNQEQTIVQISLEDNVRRLSDYLRMTDQLEGNFDDYHLISPRKFGNSENEYELGFSSSHHLYIFHSSDSGKTWAPQPPLDPYFIRLAQEHTESLSKRWEPGDSPFAPEPVLPASEFPKQNLDEIISSGVPYQPGDRGSYEPVGTTSTSLNYSTPEIKLDPRIIDSVHRFIEPSDVVDMHDGSVAVKLGNGPYRRVDSYKLDELNRIYEGYCQTAENAVPNRYRSRKMLEKSVKKNLKADLRRVIINCEKIEEDYRLTMR